MSTLAAASTDKKANTRAYVVFKEIEDGVWKVQGTAIASDSEGAIRGIENVEPGARYEAVTARSWQPKTAKVKTVTTVTLT
jgi:hypothetical protein